MKLGCIACSGYNRLYKRRKNRRQQEKVLDQLREVVRVSGLQDRIVNQIAPMQGKQLFVELYISQKKSKKLLRCLIDSGACVLFIRKSALSDISETKSFANPTKIA
uniref:Transposase n=1 Tax=Strongyloides stercoralis TaxID=6248 RepID=A0A0K0EA97_STRER